VSRNVRVLETKVSREDTTIRPLAEADLPGLAAILQWSITDGWANFETRDADPATLGETWRQRRETFPYYVADAAGTIAAAAWSSPWKAKPGYHWTAEVSVYVLPDHQGQGLARRLYERLFATLKGQGYRLLIAGVALPNEPSVKLHESFGMTKAAHFEKNGFKLGAWRDVGYWTLHLPGADPPPPVRPARETDPHQP